MILQIQLVLCLLVAGTLTPGLGQPKENLQPMQPLELVREAVANEVAANLKGDGQRFMCKDQRKTAHLDQVKLLVETRDATVGLIIAQNGHPLSADERKQEEARLANYVQNPQELARKRKQEKDDADRTMRILKALPDAFLYEADGTEKGTASIGHLGDELVRLKFRPNPAYDPPTRVEQVLTGMEGYVLVDASEKRIAQIDATLKSEVGFGWGILGHLDRGGHFLVQQADVGEHTWDITRMELSFTGKILLIKKLNIQSSDIFSNFRLVPPDLTFAQGVELAKKEAIQIEAEATKSSEHGPVRNGRANRN